MTIVDGDINGPCAVEVETNCDTWCILTVAHLLGWVTPRPVCEGDASTRLSLLIFPASNTSALLIYPEGHKEGIIWVIYIACQWSYMLCLIGEFCLVPED